MLIMVFIFFGVVVVLAFFIVLSIIIIIIVIVRFGVYRVIKNKVNEIYKLYMKVNKKGL